VKHLIWNLLIKKKTIGYAYIVTGEVGPIEFYKKACDVVVNPKKMERGF